jgi:hypothetical protein
VKISDFAFLAGLAYRSENITQSQLDGWFQGQAVDRQDVVTAWRATVNNSQVSMKLISFPGLSNFSYVASAYTHCLAFAQILVQRPKHRPRLIDSIWLFSFCFVVASRSPGNDQLVGRFDGRAAMERGDPHAAPPVHPSRRGDLDARDRSPHLRAVVPAERQYRRR